MARQELRFFRDLFRKLVDLGGRRTISAGMADVTVKMAVKLVMLVGVVHQAAGRWADRNPLDPGNLLAHLVDAVDGLPDQWVYGGANRRQVFPHQHGGSSGCNQFVLASVGSSRDPAPPNARQHCRRCAFAVP